MSIMGQKTEPLDERLRELFDRDARSEGPLAASGAGRRFTGIDLCRPLNPAQVAFLLDALSQFRIVSIARQDLEVFSLAHFERFANHWGTPVPHPNNFMRGGKPAQQDGDSDGPFELFPLSGAQPPQSTPPSPANCNACRTSRLRCWSCPTFGRTQCGSRRGDRRWLVAHGH